MTMFCYKCGKQLPDDAVFCSACGTAMQSAPVQPVTPPEPAVEPVEIKPEKEKKPKKEKKPTDPGKKKKLLMILGAVVLLAAVIGGVCLYLQNNDVADIPDPEYYFSALADTDVDDYVSSMSIEIDAETDVLKEAVQAYYELLTTSYPFELKREEPGADGKFAYLLTYNGDGYIWDRSTMCEIEIEYDGRDDLDGHYEADVWISRPKNFNIVKREQYDHSAGKLILPSPSAYFNAPDEGEYEDLFAYFFLEDPTDAVHGYMDLLQEKYGMTIIKEPDEQYIAWTLQQGEDEDTRVWIDFGHNEDLELWGIMLSYADRIALEPGESWGNGLEALLESPYEDQTEEPAPEPEPEPMPEPEPQPTQQPTQQPVSKPSNSDPSVLPDFLAHDASGKFEQVKAAWADMAVFAADDSSLSYVAENYVQVLKDMGYTVVDTEEKQKETFNVYRWYMANSAVNAETIEGNAQIYVKIMYYKNKQHSEITVAYGDGITYGGDMMTGSGGSNDFWDTCSACGGDGKCNICNGSDTVSRFQAGIGWVSQDCTSCSGGRCSFCYGTGKP